jgi:hypothetical protein
MARAEARAAFRESASGASISRFANKQVLDKFQFGGLSAM